MIRVVLVDDEELVRVGLRTILGSATEIEVVDEAADGREGLVAIRRSRPDVVLLDIRMPGLDGLAAMEQVTSQVQQPPQVVILTTFDADDMVFRSLAAGAAGFLLKDTPPDELIDAVRRVAEGDAVLSPSVTRRVVDHVAGLERSTGRRDALAATRDLTEREREVLVAVAGGLPNAEIGQTLHMSEATVKTHVTHLLQKTGRTNRVQLAIMALRAGLAD